jgi:hypothetical protein
MARVLLTERELRDFTHNLREKTVSEAEAGYTVKPFVSPTGDTNKDKAQRIIDANYSTKSTGEIEQELDRQGLGKYKHLAVKKNISPAATQPPTKPAVTTPQPKPAVTPPEQPKAAVAAPKPAVTKPAPVSTQPRQATKSPNFNQTVANMQAELKSRGYELGSTGPNSDGVDGVMGRLTKQAYDAEFGSQSMKDRSDRAALVKQTQDALHKSGEITAIPDNTANPVEKELAAQASDHNARLRQLSGIQQQPMDQYQKEAERKMHQYRLAADAKYGTNTANEVSNLPVTEQEYQHNNITTFNTETDLLALRKLANIEDSAYKVPTMFSGIKEYELKEYRLKR